MSCSKSRASDLPPPQHLADAQIVRRLQSVEDLLAIRGILLPGKIPGGQPIAQVAQRPR